MNIKKEIERINASIKSSEVVIDMDDCLFAVFELANYEYGEYTRLIVKINQLRKKCKTYSEKAAFLPYYEMVYKAQLKAYKVLRKRIRDKTVHISFSNECITLEGIKAATKKIYDQEPTADGLDLCRKLLESAIRIKIAEVQEELMILKYYSHDYINTDSTYIGPDSILRFRDLRVYYKDCTIIPTDSHSFSLSYNENTLPSAKNGLIDIMAYLNGCPYFLFTENPSFNAKLSDLYHNFDLLDMVRLRKKNYFKDKDSERPIALQMPILKATDKEHIVAISPLQHEPVLALYHASLKQFEPLPRCVFLYRVFEYGANHHYKPLVNPANYDPKSALEYYCSKIFAHKFTPLYYLAYGKVRFDSKHQKVHVIKKSQCRNYITVLKREAHSILAEWKRHNYLKNKTLGEIIYNTGRCAAAHGSSGRGMARYDYDVNYKHINDVNIILELIARYIVEQLNPGINKLVSTCHKEYISKSDLGV